MARHHKKSRKTKRRSMRGGYLSWNPLNWLKPSPTGPAVVAADGLSKTVTDTTAAAAPMVPSAPEQAAAAGVPAGSADILGPTASTATALGGRRRRTRKHRKSRKH
jgi:hypothetical protein